MSSCIELFIEKINIANRTLSVRFDLLLGDIMSEKKEFTYYRSLRVVSTDGVGFSVPSEIYPLMDDKPGGKTWIVTIREA